MLTKLLIVDDSALMRRHISQIFERAGGFELRTARDGADALRAAQEFAPHVITLDVNMPQMDGLTCLSHLMIEHPVPVVMLSSLTTKDALPTLEAMALGAVDYVAKPGGTVTLDMRKVEDELVEKVRLAARARVRRPRAARAPSPPPRTRPREAVGRLASRQALVSREVGQERVLLIGASTGGPRTLEDLLPRLPADFPYVVLLSIHMPSVFTAHFAQRMAGLCELPVVEVARSMELLPSRIHIAKGETDMVVSRRKGQLYALPAPPDPSHLWHPSVERMVASTLQHVRPERAIGVQLTGMGYDGGESLTRLRELGGHTIAESEETSVVFGMPKDLIDRGGAEIVLPIEAIADQVLRWAQDGGD